MEDDLNLFVNGRRPQLFVNGRQPQPFCKWKTNSIILKMEDDLKFVVHGRQPQPFGIWNTT
jgi:hypothetical protein